MACNRKFTDYSGVSVYLRSGVARAIMGLRTTGLCQWIFEYQKNYRRLSLPNRREKNLIFPGSLSWKSPRGTTGSAWQDVGVLAGGATLTFNWGEFYLDAGNYEGLVDKAINPTVALAPSAVWNWDVVIRLCSLASSPQLRIPKRATSPTQARATKLRLLAPSSD